MGAFSTSSSADTKELEANTARDDKNFDILFLLLFLKVEKKKIQVLLGNINLSDTQLIY